MAQVIPCSFCNSYHEVGPCPPDRGARAPMTRRIRFWSTRDHEVLFATATKVASPATGARGVFGIGDDGLRRFFARCTYGQWWVLASPARRRA